MRLCLLPLLLPFLAYAHKHQSDESQEAEKPPTELEKQGKEIMDRMMVNMAGAMVKSVFPEMSKFEAKPEARAEPVVEQQREIRRSPYSPNYGIENQRSFTLPTEASSFGQMGPIVSALASSGALDTLTGSQGQGMDPKAINEMRNQAYLAELAKHQHELTQYSAKQMEYLDQQRRYQQAVIDHQAEAALAMQKEQQQAINEALGQAKAMYARQRARVHASKTRPMDERSRRPGDDDLTSDQDLRVYFKKQYGIEIPADGTALTDDERETLRFLKLELVKKRAGGFDAMADTSAEGICGFCQPLSIRRLRGSWTQLYGNPDAMRQIFGTIRSLSRMSSRRSASSSSGKKPACVGLEIGDYSKGEAEANFFFRDDNKEHSLHELRGEIVRAGESSLTLDTDAYSTEYCIVKSGPADSDRPEYIVLADLKGTHACKSVHVFAKNTDDFNRRYFDDLSEFMKKHVREQRIMPLSALGASQLCELTAP